MGWLGTAASPSEFRSLGGARSRLLAYKVCRLENAWNTDVLCKARLTWRIVDCTVLGQSDADLCRFAHQQGLYLKGRKPALQKEQEPQHQELSDWME